MPAQKPILQFCLFLMLFPNTIKAQSRKEISNEGTNKNKNDNYFNDCQLFDSLGDHYLYAGDTSMALHFYERFVEKNPDDTKKVASLNKLRKLFQQRRHSFYLKEY